MAPEDEVLVARLEAPLETVSRVDVISQYEDTPAEVFRDVPFDPAGGEVVISPKIANLRVTAPHQHRLRLLAVDAGVEWEIGE